VLDDIVAPEFAAVPPFRLRPDDDAVRAALTPLQAAARPVIVAGGGIRWTGAAGELVALAEDLGIPVTTSANGWASIADTHRLSAGVVGTYSRECANQIVNRADLVCFIGTQTCGMTTHFWTVPTIGTPPSRSTSNRSRSAGTIRCRPGCSVTPAWCSAGCGS
jgi:acetolactate synthase-1/2/3 large subunit